MSGTMTAIPFDGHAIAAETTAFLSQTGLLLINGQWQDAASGKLREA